MLVASDSVKCDSCSVISFATAGLYLY